MSRLESVEWDTGEMAANKRKRRKKVNLSAPLCGQLAF